MIVVQDALPKEVAEGIREAFDLALYTQHTQTKGDYYAPGEPYLCRFKRAHKLEAEGKVFADASSALCSVMKKAGLQIDNLEVFAYKMSEGDFFREHDDVKNGTGFIYYLCRKWTWDWGGILIVEEDGVRTPICPKFNQLVVLKKGSPHFVTPVTSYAREHRYAMVGFIK